MMPQETAEDGSKSRNVRGTHFSSAREYVRNYLPCSPHSFQSSATSRSATETMCSASGANEQLQSAWVRGCFRRTKGLCVLVADVSLSLSLSFELMHHGLMFKSHIVRCHVHSLARVAGFGG